MKTTIEKRKNKHNSALREIESEKKNVFFLYLKRDLKII